MMSKFAGDTYLLVGSKHLGSADQELQHVTKCAKNNILRLNPAKTRELIVSGRGLAVTCPSIPVWRGPKESLPCWGKCVKKLINALAFPNFFVGREAARAAFPSLRLWSMDLSFFGPACSLCFVS